MEIINVGANPNDNTGDRLRDGFIKVNKNFVEIDNKINIMNDLPYLGSIIPTSVPSGTGSGFWNATQAGTYSNFGNLVVLPNSYATISRTSGGTFSISQTLLDLSTYNKIIDTKLSDSIIRGINLFTIAGKYINSTTGAESVDVNYKSTDYIPLTNVNTLIATNLTYGGFFRQVAFFSDRTAASFISAYTADNNATVTLNSGNIPATTKYIRMTAATAAVPVLTYDGADSNIKLANNIVKAYTDSKQNEALLSGKDLFNFTGYYVNKTTGVEEINAGYKCTDYIPLVQSDILNATNLAIAGAFRQASFFSDKASTDLISSYTADDGTAITLNTANIPAGTKYVRFNTALANVPVLKLNNILSIKENGTKIDGLISDIDNDLKLELGIVPFSNGYVNMTTGVVDTSTGTYKCSDYLPYNDTLIVTAKNLFYAGAFRQASFFSDRGSSFLIGNYTADNNFDIVLNKTNVPAGTKYIRFNTQTVKSPVVYSSKVITASRYKSKPILKVMSAAWGTINSTSGYSTFYGRYWQASGSFVNNNGFIQLVYAVTPGETIRVEGNCDTGNNPLVAFFSDANLTSFVANGTTSVINGIKYYNSTEVVPSGATYCMVQQRRVLDIKQPFTRLVVDSDIEEVPRKLMLTGDSLTQMVGYAAEELMTLVKGVDPRYDIYNYGIGGEKTNEILSRIGAFQMYLTPDNSLLTTDASTGRKYFTLPANTSTVSIGANSISNSWNSSTLNLLVQTTPLPDCDPKYVVVNGIKCLLTLSSGNYSLNRLVAGSTTEKIYLNTEIIPYNRIELTGNDIAIINVGQNGGYTTVDDLVEQYKRAVDSLGTKKYIVLSTHFSQNSNPAGADYVDNRIDLETKLRKEFGAKYFNTREYFTSKAVDDALASGWWNAGTYPTDIGGEVHPTATDISHMTAGKFAPMFWSNPNNSSDIIHLSRRSYLIMYKRIFEVMKTLRYFE